eukprot:UN00859
MVHPNSNNENTSIYNEKMHTLCTEYSSTINLLEAEYLLKCEKYLKHENIEQNYLEFSRSEKEELKIVRSLLQKLLHSVPELYSMENVSNRLCLNSELFVNWLYNKDQQPLIINDLHQNKIPDSLPQNKYISMYALGEMMDTIKTELNTLSNDSQLNINDTLIKVNELLIDFENIDVGILGS